MPLTRLHMHDFYTNWSIMEWGVLCWNQWFESFLHTNRTQQVVIEDYYSTPCDITSGVPQGSVLGPVLFIIYNINDITTNIHSELQLFPGDILIYRPIHSSSDQKTLQDDITTLIKYGRWTSTYLNVTSYILPHITPKILHIKWMG